MDKITPEMIMNSMVVVAGLIGFALGCWSLIDKIHAARKPKDDLTRWMQDTDTKLKHDNDRIATIKKGNDVVCRGILALLSHEINGNSVDKLTASQKEITDYLIDR